MRWDAANAFAQSGFETGATDWHLATVTNSAENQVLQGLVDQVGSRPIFGLVQAGGAHEPDGGRGWITGEALTYTNWTPGEPNNVHQANGLENIGTMYGPDTAHSGQWNDATKNDRRADILVDLDTSRAITLGGGTRADVLVGGAFGDAASGNDGKDVLRGEGGNDTLLGGAGNDMLICGAGQDQMSGGAGAFVFAVTDVGAVLNPDQIVDFELGVDRINRRLIDANLGLAGNQAFTFIGTAAFSAAAGELRLGTTKYGQMVLQGQIDGIGLDFIL